MWHDKNTELKAFFGYKVTVATTATIDDLEEERMLNFYADVIFNSLFQYFAVVFLIFVNLI